MYPWKHKSFNQEITNSYSLFYNSILGINKQNNILKKEINNYKTTHVHKLM